MRQTQERLIPEFCTAVSPIQEDSRELIISIDQLSPLIGEGK
jgi:hypothetical protein